VREIDLRKVRHAAHPQREEQVTQAVCDHCDGEENNCSSSALVCQTVGHTQLERVLRSAVVAADFGVPGTESNLLTPTWNAFCASRRVHGVRPRVSRHRRFKQGKFHR
jgi:hypothetical protein